MPPALTNELFLALRFLLIFCHSFCGVNSFVRPALSVRAHGRTLSARPYEFELRETKILLNKIWNAGKSIGLDPKDEFTLRLQGYLNTIIDAGSPIELNELDSNNFFNGKWQLVYSNDPRSTILQNPVGGVTKVFLDIGPRVGNAFGSLVQRVELDGKPGLRGEAKYAVVDSGLVQLQYEKVFAIVMGMEVEAPGGLVQQASTSIRTSWFDGKLWIERIGVQDATGVPEAAQAAIVSAASAAGVTPYLYNVYRFDSE